jgi:predicted permease
MSLLSDLIRDVRYAARTFRRESVFVVGVVLTFALVIGANAAMFGLVQRLMLAPPPGIRTPERVVTVGFTLTVGDASPFTMTTTSYPAYRDLATLGSVFSATAAVRTDSMTVGRGADLTEVATVQATGGYFATLGVTAAYGRVFDAGDDATPNGNDVVVLGYDYWQRRFGGDPSAIGEQLVVDGQPLTVIGTTSRAFTGTELAPVDLYVPLTTAMRKQGTGWMSDSRIRTVAIVARLRDGVTPAAASTAAARALRESGALPADRLTSVVLESVVPGESARHSLQARIALWLAGVSVVVLLIATANVGTLLLLRAAKRRRDAAIRVSLGASGRQLARQALVDGVMLALAGCVLGLVLARWIADLVRITVLPNVAIAGGGVDGNVLAATVIASCLAGLAASLGPIAQLGRTDLSAELRSGGGHGASGRVMYQHLLLAVQVALSFVLLVGAGLFVRSLQRVQSQDLGFSTAHLLYVTLDFHGAPLPGPERDRIYADAMGRVAVVPGVTNATVVQGMPFGPHNIPPIHVPGYVMPPPTVQQLPIMYEATPAYLEMMGVRLVEGRLFTRADTAGTPLVVLVNETMARTMWPGRSAIGGCVQAGHGPDLGGDPMAAAALLPCRTVVGVVHDSRARSLRTEGNEARLPQYYVPVGQVPSPPIPNLPNVGGLLVRTAGDPERSIAAVQRIIQASSPVEVYARVRPYQALIDPQLRSWRLGATLFTAFGLLALGIAAVGLFAVVSYVVSQRTREIGVRLALGGSGGRVGRLVIRDALRMAAAGAIAGVAVALAGAPLAQSMLFETSARQPSVLATAVLVLLVVTVGAAAVPAWRASRVSPMTVLRDAE